MPQLAHPDPGFMHMTDLYAPFIVILECSTDWFYGSYIDGDDRLKLQRTFGMVVFPRETLTRYTAVVRPCLRNHFLHATVGSLQHAAKQRHQAP